MTGVRVFSDLAVTSYEQPGHPEAPWRVEKTFRRLEAAGLRPEAPFVAASEADVLTVHTVRHWKALRTGAWSDPDTPRFEGIAGIAMTSLSGCLSALESAQKREPAFSLMRPPGHHAGAERIAGFCYLSNMAIACRKALASGLKVAVLDVDVHHGDGTEELALGRDGWLFVSLHQSPLYPGTGLVSRENCLNFPLPPYTGEKDYMSVLEGAIRVIMDFKPDILGVSAGFDTYKECPIAQLKLEKGTYIRVGRRIAETGLNRFALLEGGYAPDLPELVENFLKGFA